MSQPVRCWKPVPLPRAELCRGALMLVLMVAPLAAQEGAFDWSQGQELYSGIHFSQIKLEKPRKQVIQGVRIDLWTPGLRFHTTPRREQWEEGKTETDRQTTRDFLRRSRAGGVPMVLAVNADAFSPWPVPYNQSTPTDLLGLAISKGTLVSHGSGSPSLLRMKSGRWRIARTPRDFDNRDVELAVSGFALCLVDGQPAPSGEDRHPRTGLGLSADGRYLIAVAIDGRQPASVGATTHELGQWLKHFGAHRGINMDGGGSTTLAWWDPTAPDRDKCRLLNRPVGAGRLLTGLLSGASTERANGNNLGVSVHDSPTTHDANLYLFADDHWIAEKSGLVRIHNQAKPLETPIIWPDDPKTEADCAWGNVIRESDGRFRMWYCTMNMGHNGAGPHEMAKAGVWGRGDNYDFRPRSENDRPEVESMLGKYAESEDGIHWRKPSLGLIAYRGAKENNIVLTGRRAAEQTHGALTNFDGYTILRDDAEKDPNRRYKMIAHWESVHHWDNHPLSGALGRPKERMDQFAAARGEYITYSPDGLRWEQALERLDTIPTAGGDRLLVVPDRRNHRWMAYVRAGGWAWPALSYSSNLTDWSAAEPARQITPADVNAPAVECMIPFNYGNQDLGFPCGMDKSKGAFTVMLAGRQQGGAWKWVNRQENFIPHGPPGSYYATGAVPLHNEPFVVGDEMFIYFNAFSRDPSMASRFGNRSIGVARLRRDGFAGLKAEANVGELKTKPITLSGDALRLNVEQRTANGEVTVALLDEQGAELPGYGFADAIPIASDAVRAPVAWRSHADLKPLVGTTASLAVRLRGGAVVYAFALENTTSE